MINCDGHACLADFGLFTVASDQSSVLSSWYGPMDEPRTPQPRKNRFGEGSSNKGIGLLRTGDGGVRSSQWADTIRPG